MSYSIQCVHCQAVLKSSAPVPVGKSVKCPKCQQAFTTPGEESAKTYAITCSHCKAVLRSPTPVPPGKKVKCPKCSESFTTPGEEAPPEKPTAKPMPAGLNISIFTGDADAAIANLMNEAHGTAPKLDDDLVTEEDAENETPK